MKKLNIGETMCYITLISVVASLLFVCGYEYHLMQLRNKAYRQYYIAVENVLDETCNVYDSFMDTVGEGDNYQDYLDCRSKVIKLRR